MSVTLENLKSALAGESMAHIKYSYFSILSRVEPYDIALHFSYTAKQEILHAYGHLELLIGKPTTAECFDLASKVAVEVSQQTDANPESAFSVESQAYIKYNYFAKMARAEGFEDAARQFEDASHQVMALAFKHLEMLVGSPDIRKCLELAIEGETYEFTTMYPEFRLAAEQEGNALAVAEADTQIAESKEHAEQFKQVLALAEKRFAALAGVEKRHAEAYQQKLESL